jgi:hypothetical protein
MKNDKLSVAPKCGTFFAPGRQLDIVAWQMHAEKYETQTHFRLRTRQSCGWNRTKIAAWDFITERGD